MAPRPSDPRQRLSASTRPPTPQEEARAEWKLAVQRTLDGAAHRMLTEQEPVQRLQEQAQSGPRFVIEKSLQKGFVAPTSQLQPGAKFRRRALNVGLIVSGVGIPVAAALGVSRFVVRRATRRTHASISKITTNLRLASVSDLNGIIQDSKGIGGQRVTFKDAAEQAVRAFKVQRAGVERHVRSRVIRGLVQTAVGAAVVILSPVLVPYTAATAVGLVALPWALSGATRAVQNSKVLRSGKLADGRIINDYRQVAAEADQLVGLRAKVNDPNFGPSDRGQLPSWVLTDVTVQDAQRHMTKIDALALRQEAMAQQDLGHSAQHTPTPTPTTPAASRAIGTPSGAFGL